MTGSRVAYSASRKGGRAKRSGREEECTTVS